MANCTLEDVSQSVSHPERNFQGISSNRSNFCEPGPAEEVAEEEGPGGEREDLSKRITEKYSNLTE